MSLIEEDVSLIWEVGRVPSREEDVSLIWEVGRVPSRGRIEGLIRPCSALGRPGLGGRFRCVKWKGAAAGGAVR